LDFHQLVLADKEITSRVPPKQIEYAFNLKRQLKNVDKIFARVFGNKIDETKIKGSKIKKSSASKTPARPRTPRR